MRNITKWLCAMMMVALVVGCAAQAEPTESAEISETEPPTEAATPTDEPTDPPEPTETDEPTEAPTERPTRTPTPAPTALPDELAAITLQAADLPEGFEPLVLGGGIEATEVIVTDFTVGGASAFTHPTNGETVIAYWVLLEDEDEQAQFDAYLENELATSEMITLMLLAGGGTMSLSFDEPQPVAGLGDTAMQVVISGEQQQELVGFRRGSIGAIVLHVYPSGSAPLIRTTDITAMLDGRIEAALAVE